MKSKIVFIERKFLEFVSIEKVFRQIAAGLSKKEFQICFEQMKFGQNLSGIIKNLIFYKKPEADIYHITGHIHFIALRLPREKTVLTIHDLRFLHRRKGLRRYLLKKLFLDYPVRRLRYITAISDATKDEILKYTNCDPAKIRVVENPAFSNISLDNGKKFNEDCPTILQIGTSPNKNLPNLIKALDGIKCKLEIIGRLDSVTLELLDKHKIDFTNSFEVDDYEMLEKYKQADLVSFCSTYEGFGLPIIEAQAMRTPLLTSNISPLKEVAADGAILVDPDDFLEIRKGILKIIGDADKRAEIVQNGLKNIRRFEPEKIAGKYKKIYTEILEETKFNAGK